MEKEFIYFCRHFWLVLRGVAPFWAAGIAGGSRRLRIREGTAQRALRAHIAAGASRCSRRARSASPRRSACTARCRSRPSFSEKGMDDGVLAAFMMSSVLLNPQLMIYTAALGAEALAARTAAAFLCGAAAGFLVRALLSAAASSISTASRARRTATQIRTLAAAPAEKHGPQRPRHSAGLPRRRRADRRAHAPRPVARDSGSVRRKRASASPPRRSRACRSTSAAAARYRCSPSGWAAAWAIGPAVAFMLSGPRDEADEPRRAAVGPRRGAASRST